MNCIKCSLKCIKYGYQSNRVQRYYCKSCKKTQLKEYQYAGRRLENKKLFLRCHKVGNGIRGISRILQISTNTVMSWIRKYGSQSKSREFFKRGDEYEVDELCTYIGNKERKRWVVVAKSRSTGDIIDIQIGTRTKKQLKLVIDKLLMLSPKRIYTDNLNIYRYIIPKEIHERGKRKINHVERFNLTLRTHVKRLNRRTICYSKSKLMLEYSIRLYLWG